LWDEQVLSFEENFQERLKMELLLVNALMIESRAYMGVKYSLASPKENWYEREERLSKLPNWRKQPWFCGPGSKFIKLLVQAYCCDHPSLSASSLTLLSEKVLRDPFSLTALPAGYNDNLNKGTIYVINDESKFCPIKLHNSIAEEPMTEWKNDIVTFFSYPKGIGLFNNSDGHTEYEVMEESEKVSLEREIVFLKMKVESSLIISCDKSSKDYNYFKKDLIRYFRELESNLLPIIKQHYEKSFEDVLEILTVEHYLEKEVAKKDLPLEKFYNYQKIKINSLKNK
jgi:hypothetical protein